MNHLPRFMCFQGQFTGHLMIYEYHYIILYYIILYYATLRYLWRICGLTGSMLDHRSLPPVFESRRWHI